MMDERGSVGVLIALVMFFVMGMLMMTWNTVQISKDKMRLQNAVDSAALAHATWQARSMNAIQNMNEEKYFALDLAIDLTKIGVVAEKLAQGFWKAAKAASAFPPAMYALEALAWASRFVGYCSACTAGWMQSVVVPILDVFQQIYQWCPIAGFLNAQNFAAYNGANRLFSTELKFTDSESALFTASTIPITAKYVQLFQLPVEKNKPAKKPWKYTASDDTKTTFKGGTFKTGAGVYKTFHAGESWDKEAFESKKSGTGSGSAAAIFPEPIAWLAMKSGKQIEALPLELIAGEGYQNVDNMPVFAIGAAQCITGDIVPHADNTSAKQRPIGFGTGATAKLVPVSTVLTRINEKLGNIGSAIFFH